MKCRHCNGDTGVRETRAMDGYTRRVRICEDCGEQLRTVEVAIESFKDLGTHEPVIVPRVEIETLIKALSSMLRLTVTPK